MYDNLTITPFCPGAPSTPTHPPIFISPLLSQPLHHTRPHPKLPLLLSLSCFAILRSPVMADAGAISSSSGSGRMRWCTVPEKAQLHMAMLALQFGYAGFHVVSRAALNMGISKLVFPVYRNIIALLLLLPFAYFIEKYEVFRSFGGEKQ